MKFDRLVDRFGQEPYFDYAAVCLLFPEGEQKIRTALYRLKKSNHLIELRRGLYTLPERYRKSPLTGPTVAGALYSPSYLSERWALSFYGIIPEKTVAYTSVTPRPTKTFHNAFGSFTYRTLKPSLFSGFRQESIMGSAARIATPEKALVDLWYLEAGEWTERRMEAMRFEPRAIATITLVEAVRSASSPRMTRAAQAWLRYADEAAQGTIEL
jgi:Predicted transcriptional regulator